VLHIEAQGTFPARTSNLCGWCDHKPICPAWSHLYQTAALPEAERALEDGVVLVDEYLRLGSEISALKERQDEVKAAIDARAKADGAERLFGSTGSVKVYRYPSVSIPDAKDPLRREFEAEVRALGLWDRYSALSGYQLSRAIQDGAVGADELARLEPYLERSEGVKLYPCQTKP